MGQSLTNEVCCQSRSSYVSIIGGALGSMCGLLSRDTSEVLDKYGEETQNND